MNKKKMITDIIVLCFFSILCCVVGGVIYKFIQYEKNQNMKISQLQEDMSLLKAELNGLKKNPTRTELSDTAFNYFAIGNSITKHGLSDYWWNEGGMAASTEDRDYAHLISSYLEDIYGEVCLQVFNYYTWESQATDRAETYELIDPYLDERLNLVTIQLSENVSDMSTFEADYEELIRYIQEWAPNAQIIIIDDFWYSDDKSILKEEAAEKTGVEFVSLSEIKGDPEYLCGMGTTVYDTDGGAHIVEHNGVAAHPGDKGMEYIANAVISVIK